MINYLRDKWDDFFISDYFIPVLIFLFAAFFISLFYAVGSYDIERKERYMSQCLKDGRKEYECWAIIRGEPSRNRVVPIFIPK